MGRETSRPNLLQPAWPGGLSKGVWEGITEVCEKCMKRRCSPGYRGCRRGDLAAAGNPEDDRARAATLWHPIEIAPGTRSELASFPHIPGTVLLQPGVQYSAQPVTRMKETSDAVYLVRQ